jgi:hypothetical protein
MRKSLKRLLANAFGVKTLNREALMRRGLRGELSESPPQQQ